MFLFFPLLPPKIASLFFISVFSEWWPCLSVWNLDSVGRSYIFTLITTNVPTGTNASGSGSWICFPTPMNCFSLHTVPLPETSLQPSSLPGLGLFLMPYPSWEHWFIMTYRLSPSPFPLAILWPCVAFRVKREFLNSDSSSALSWIMVWKILVYETGLLKKPFRSLYLFVYLFIFVYVCASLYVCHGWVSRRSSKCSEPVSHLSSSRFIY